ncbi:MAG: heparan-alpha-glucosaminide N-acetyltransferase [Jannaschia sp.]
MTGGLPGRILLLDWARTAALFAMAAFHFGRDFEVLGLVPPGTTFGGWWDISARAIAGTFVFLAGIGLWLAHGKGIRWGGFLRRLGWLVLAAGGVSLATYLAVPGAWVRFGILHSIALSSVVALPFLRLPSVGTVAVAAAILWWGPGLALPAFDPIWLVWTGLGTRIPPMIDYEPLVPWLAPMLLGVAAGRLGTRFELWPRLAKLPSSPGTISRVLAWPGQHSLAFYLIHQPALIALIGAGAWLAQRL